MPFCFQCLLFSGHDAGDAEAGQSSSSSQRDPAEFAEARIDIRRFAQFLSSQQVNPNRVICSEYYSQWGGGTKNLFFCFFQIFLNLFYHLFPSQKAWRMHLVLVYDHEASNFDCKS